MNWLQSITSLTSEFLITIANGNVWLSIGYALMAGGVSLLLGVGVARTVGLLKSTAPAGETLGVGLASGLLVIAAWWAAIASGGRSSFTPVAVGFALAIAVAVAQRARHRQLAPHDPAVRLRGASDSASARSRRRRSVLRTTLASAIFVVAVALLYGSTMAPSPRDGLQPVEFVDEAFYSILGADLAETGTESIYPASGFSDPGFPIQTWYHWGEMWLASAVITIFGSAPLAARNFIVLPVMLLAAAALTGTIVRKVAGTTSRRAYLFGFLACLFLAPIPFASGPFFTSWGGGLVFGITLYGLGAVAVLLGLYNCAVLASRDATWALAIFVGSAAAMLVPAHLVIAVLAFVGVGSVWGLRVIQSLSTTQRLPIVWTTWKRATFVAGIGVVTTVIWGTWTGHATIGTTGAPNVMPFNDVWRNSVILTTMLSGIFLLIPLAWVLVRRQSPFQADLYVGTGALLVAGAIVWGARISEFTMFYLFYAGIAAIATPVAVIAAWTVLGRLREKGHFRLALGLFALCLLQIELGTAFGLQALQRFGPHEYPPISMDLLAAIRQLPPNAKLAYACGPFEEVGFAGSRMLSINANTDRRVVPMCYEAERLSEFLGAELSLEVPNAFFKWAPQRALYPDASANPSSEEVADFLRAHGIEYIYADKQHPNTLVEFAVLVASGGEAQVLRIP